MPSALVFLAEGAEEMETVITVDVLRRGGVSHRSCRFALDFDGNRLNRSGRFTSVQFLFIKIARCECCRNSLTEREIFIIDHRALDL